MNRGRVNQLVAAQLRLVVVRGRLVVMKRYELPPRKRAVVSSSRPIPCPVVPLGWALRCFQWVTQREVM